MCNMIEEKKFKTESKELLNLMINSIYSNKEVFLRELISNASDAIDKYKILALSSEGKYPVKDYQILISKDEKEKYIQIQDNGIGMSHDDIEKNLGTIAKSGTKEFLEKYKEAKAKNEDVDLIGQFGVGFYSAFMVAKKIEVYTKDLEGKSYVFSSDGVETYSIEDKAVDFLKDSGTAVRVYLKDDTEDEKYSQYLEDYEIKSLVRKYSDFIRYPIVMNCRHSVQDKDKDGKEIEGKFHDEYTMETLNSMVPLWKKPKKDVTDKDLAEFYKTRFNDYEEPLLSMNIKAEGMLEYNALVFIPSHAPYNLYAQDYEKGLALYAKGIFIEEKNKELVPDYLKFVRGLIDSEDLSLNISREMLQKSPLLNKIATALEKKIVDRLKQLKEEDYEKYLTFFKEYGNFIKFGIYSSYGMKKDMLEDLLVFKTLKNDKPISLKTYKENMAKDQKAIYYASGKTVESIKMLPEMERFRRNGMDVLLLDDNVDEFCITMMQKYDDVEFKNITAVDKEALSEEEKKKIDELESENKALLDLMKEALKDKVDDVSFSLALGDNPVSIQTKDGLSMNMENVLNAENPETKNNPEEKVKASKVLQINPDNALFSAVKDEKDSKKIQLLSSVLYNEAVLAEGFEIEDKAQFVKDLNELILSLKA